MDASVLQHLHSVTLRTLQSHSFNRSSSTAAHTLTDVLCRYLLLLVSSAKANAEHAGRDPAGVNAIDVLDALEDVGVGLDELKDYLRLEAGGMSHLTLERAPVPLETIDPDDEKAVADAISAARRIDSLADIKAATMDGLTQDLASMHLSYRRVPSPQPQLLPSPSSSPLSVDLNMSPVRHPEETNNMDLDSPLTARAVETQSIPLVLPPSPISNPSRSPPTSPSSPSYKRRRRGSWEAPEHIPNFLPPFPGASRGEPSRDSMETSTATLKPTEPDREPKPRRRIPLPLRPSSSSKSSYTKAIPYSQSTAVLNFGDLPNYPPLPQDRDRPPKTPSGPNTLQLLIAAHNAVPPDPQPASNPARLRIANVLASTAPRRYGTSDTLFGSSEPPYPRHSAPLPSFPKPPPDSDPSSKRALPFPKPTGRLVSENMRLATSAANMPWLVSNLDYLERAIIPPHIHARMSRTEPPAPLGAEEPLVYHEENAIPAPWNANAGADASEEFKRRELKKSSAARDQYSTNVPKIPDATLYATWDWMAKQPGDDLTQLRRGRTAAYPTSTHIGGQMGVMSPSEPFVAPPKIGGFSLKLKDPTKRNVPALSVVINQPYTSDLVLSGVDSQANGYTESPSESPFQSQPPVHIPL